MSDIVINIEQGINQIQDLLTADETIGRLLAYDTPNALIKPAPDINLYENLIYNKPIVKEPPTRFITVSVPKTSRVANTSTYVSLFIIDVFVTIDIWDLDDRKLRLHRLANRIKEILEDKKLHGVGSLNLKDMEPVTIKDGFYAGYSLIFSASDEQL